MSEPRIYEPPHLKQRKKDCTEIHLWHFSTTFYKAYSSSNYKGYTSITSVESHTTITSMEPYTIIITEKSSTHALR